MRSCILLVALVVALSAGACSNGESAPVDEAGGTEAELRDVVTRYADAFLNGDYKDAYYLHTSEWQSRCPLGDWIQFMTSQWQGLSDQIVTAGGDMSAARFVVTVVEVEGTRGVHQGYVEAAGQTFEFGDQGHPNGLYWVWRDGRWQATDDWARPCAR
jgi:hypothetical protein